MKVTIEKVREMQWSTTDIQRFLKYKYDMTGDDRYLHILLDLDELSIILADERIITALSDDDEGGEQ